MPTRCLYLDTETTGKSSSDELVEVTLIDEDGLVLLDTLCNPGFHIPDGARAIHGISDEMVATAPSAHEVKQRVYDLCDGAEVLIYNAAFDCRFLPELKRISKVRCVMQDLRRHLGQTSSVNLKAAADITGFDWGAHGDPHRAKADAFAARHVDMWLRAQMILAFPLETQKAVAPVPAPATSQQSLDLFGGAAIPHPAQRAFQRIDRVHRAKSEPPPQLFEVPDDLLTDGMIEAGVQRLGQALATMRLHGEQSRKEVMLVGQVLGVENRATQSTNRPFIAARINDGVSTYMVRFFKGGGSSYVQRLLSDAQAQQRPLVISCAINLKGEKEVSIHGDTILSAASFGMAEAGCRRGRGFRAGR